MKTQEKERRIVTSKPTNAQELATRRANTKKIHIRRRESAASRTWAEKSNNERPKAPQQNRKEKKGSSQRKHLSTKPTRTALKKTQNGGKTTTQREQQLIAEKYGWKKRFVQKETRRNAAPTKETPKIDTTIGAQPQKSTRSDTAKTKYEN